MKNNRRKIFVRALSLLAVIMLLVFTSACGPASSSSGNVEMKTVTDCMGRTVEIPADPQRVACMYASVVHMMALLDEGDKIVGLPKGAKTDVLIQMKYPDLAEKASPYREGMINIEETLSIGADLVILRQSTAEDGGEVEKLEEQKIPYVVVDYDSIEDVKTAMTVMGEVFDKQDKAAAYNDYIDQTLDMVDERLEGVDPSEWPEAYHSVNEAIRTDSADSICAEIMERAHVKDVAVERGLQSNGDKTYTTLEEIYNWDPDAFVANESSVTEYILTDSKWSGLSAVKEKAVYTLPVGATRWCHPGSMEPQMGVIFLAKLFYPDRFEDVDLAQVTKDYYKEYFGVELDDETVANILAGEGMRKSNSAVKQK